MIEQWKQDETLVETPPRSQLSNLRKRSIRFIAAAALVLLAVAQPGHAAVTREDFTVTSEPGITVFVREVRSEAEGAPARKPPVILLHGARVPGVASFDLPVEGGSLAADIAEAGHRTFIMDARGYGGSTRPEAMNRPPGPVPLVKSHEVVRDIDAVVRSVKQRTGATQVALLGWATGGHWAGMYASLHPEQVSHLIMLNSLYGGSDRHAMLGHGTSSEMPGQPGRFNAPEVGGYRYNTAASLISQWDRSIPLEDKTLWRDPRVVEAYQREALASDPTSAQRDPPSFRSPNGALEDSFYLAIGRQLWDAASITARVLIVRSENDFWSRPEDVTTLQRHLVRAAEVRVLDIPEATHFVHLDRPERGRALFLAQVKSFLDGASSSSAQSAVSR